MTQKLPEPDPRQQPIDTRTLWIESGSGPGWAPPADSRPEYSPAALVLAVQGVLRADGVEVDPRPAMMSTATIAAADLLRALGVRPANVPEKA